MQDNFQRQKILHTRVHVLHDLRKDWFKPATSFRHWIDLLHVRYLGCSGAISKGAYIFPIVYECKRNCTVAKYLESVDRVPGYELLETPFKKLSLLHGERTNVTLGKIVGKIWKDCRAKCYFNPCRENFTQTSTDVTMGTDMSISVKLLINQQADTSTSAQPTMTFVDYFTFVTSCFGTWFGLSFLSIDPLKMLAKKDEQRFVVRFPSRTWICTSVPRNRQWRHSQKPFYWLLIWVEPNNQKWPTFDVHPFSCFCEACRKELGGVVRSILFFRSKFSVLFWPYLTSMMDELVVAVRFYFSIKISQARAGIAQTNCLSI